MWPDLLACRGLSLTPRNWNVGAYTESDMPKHGRGSGHVRLYRHMHSDAFKRRVGSSFTVLKTTLSLNTVVLNSRD